MFETYQPPALYIAKNAMLSSFAYGRPTSLLLHSGEVKLRNPVIFTPFPSLTSKPPVCVTHVCLNDHKWLIGGFR